MSSLLGVWGLSCSPVTSSTNTSSAKPVNKPNEMYRMLYRPTSGEGWSQPGGGSGDPLLTAVGGSAVHVAADRRQLGLGVRLVDPGFIRSITRFSKNY